MKQRFAIVVLMTLVLASAAPVAQPALAAQSTGARILRDSYGVPHVYADNLYDLFYGNGYAMAQDRLTQLELYRRAALGRLAEALGADMLQSDIAARRDLYTRPERDALLATLPAQQQMILEAYRDGINARLAEVRADPWLMPWDLMLMGVTPADWQVDDTVAVAAFMARTFGEFGGDGELAYQQLYQYLLATFGPTQGGAIFNDVVPLEDPGAPTTIHGAPAPAAAAVPATRSSLLVANGMLDDVLSAAARVRRARESIGVPTKLGSFWWAVTGSRSTTGNALLFGGPQMGYATPNVGYEVALHGAGLNVRGLSFAGAPGVLIGQNGRVAWSVTSGFGDQVDVYAEVLDPADPTRYSYQGGWQVMEHRTETIQVKGGAPVTLEVYRTVHGPVVATDPASHIALSQRRAHWGLELAAWQGMLQMDSITSVAEGVQAAAAIPMSYNFLFADQQGHIGYRQAGRQPVRAPGFDRRLPLPGTRQAEWQGFLGADAMPHVIDPPGGSLGNWNNKPMPGWGNGDAVSWGSVDRVQRILTLLGDSGKLSPEAVKAIAPDIGRHDYRADALLPFLLDALAVPGISSDPRLPQAKQMLADWNHRGDEGAVGESIFSEWRTQVFSDTLGDELGTYLVPLQALENPVGDSLLFRTLQGPDASLPVAHDYFNGVRPELALVNSLSRTLDTLTARNGTPDMTKWPFSPGTIDFKIGPFTVAQIPWYSRGSYMQFLELAQPSARGENILPPGQSGTLLVDSQGHLVPDAHFEDQVELARSWQYKPMPLYYDLAPTQYLPLIVR
jgi:penicillin G amidase